MTAPNILDRVLGAPMSAARPTGLLTAEDYAAARRQGLLGLGTGLLAASGGPGNLTQRLGAGVQAGQGAYQGALDRASAQAMATQQYDVNQFKLGAAQRDQAREQQLQQAREQIIAANPLPEATDGAALSQWIDKVLPSFIRIGDTDTLGKLSEIRKSLAPKERSVVHVDQGDKIAVLDALTGETIRVLPKAATPGQLMHGELMTPAAAARAENSIIARFDAQSKDYVKAHEAWTQVDNVLQRARSNTHSPDDIVQLIDGISRLNNPGAIVRSSTVALQLQKIGSYSDKLRMWIGRGAQGAWPTDIVEGIARAAREIAIEHQKQFNSLRDRAIKRGEHIGLDYLGEVLPNTWEGANLTGTPAGAPPLSSFKFGGIPVAPVGAQP